MFTFLYRYHAGDYDCCLMRIENNKTPGQQSLPSFVDAVRISDIGQGTNPFRIVSMRALPDHPTDKE